MKEMKSERTTFLDFIRKDWVREYAKRIVFAVILFLIIHYAVGYISALPVKVDPYDILTMRCIVSKDAVVVDIKEWADEQPEKKFDEIKYRYDEIDRTLYISLILSDDGEYESFSEQPIENDFRKLKKVVVEGGILNVHQKTIWYDGEETIAVKPSPSPSGNKKK